MAVLRRRFHSMSFSNQLRKHTFGGCLAGLLAVQLVTASECPAQTNPPSEKNYSERQSDGAGQKRTVQQDRPLPDVVFITPVIVPEEKKSESGPYDPDCERPKNVEDGNFCQQRRAAKAGEDAARAGEDAANVARWQLWLSVGGLLGLIITVVLTFIAARAARDAAMSAARSADIADVTLKEIGRNSERQLRAYLSIQLTGFNFSRVDAQGVKGVFCEANYVITNAGQTPAYNVETDITFILAPWPLQSDLPPPPRNAVTYNRAVAPQHTIEGNVVKIERAIPSPKEFLYVHGLITYRDAFDATQTTSFCGYIEQTAMLFNSQLLPGNVKTTFKFADRHNEAS